MGATLGTKQRATVGAGRGDRAKETAGEWGGAGRGKEVGGSAGGGEGAPARLKERDRGVVRLNKGQ